MANPFKGVPLQDFGSVEDARQWLDSHGLAGMDVRNNQTGEVSEGENNGWAAFINTLNGNTYQNQVNAEQADIAWTRSSAAAAEDRAWQEHMSNTAYQRSVADMKAAGLNPAAYGVDGASTPSGAMAQATPGSASTSGSDFLSGLLGVAKAAISIALFKKFSHSAAMSGSAAGMVKKVGQELSEVRNVYNRMGILKGSTRITRSVRDLFG